MEFFKHLKTEYWNGKSVGGKVKTILLATMTLIFSLFVTLFVVAMFIHAPWIAVIIFSLAVVVVGLWGVITLFEEWGQYKRKRTDRW